MHPPRTLPLFPIKKGLPKSANPLIIMAGAKGIEPSTSGVTGRRSNQAELRPRIFYFSCGIATTLPLHNEVVGGTGLEPVTSGL
jgi:hypothetical protein